MTFVLPLALLLLLPLAVAGFMASSERMGWAGQLPGIWNRVIATPLRSHVIRHSGLRRAGAPFLCLTLAVILIFALARPGVQADRSADYANLAGRVLVLDVGPDLAGHQLFIDALQNSDVAAATAVVAVSGDAYRIVPFTTDTSQIDRYVRVLDASMMPAPGQRPHLGLAQAEKILQDAGFLVRQIVLVSAQKPPQNFVDVPETESHRVVIALNHQADWAAWSEGWGADLRGPDDVDWITGTLDAAAKTAASAELPTARFDISMVLLCLAAGFWLLLFRQRAS